MDNNNLLYGSVILGLLGLVIFFYLLEVTIIQALNKFLAHFFQAKVMPLEKQF